MLVHRSRDVEGTLAAFCVFLTQKSRLKVNKRVYAMVYHRLQSSCPYLNVHSDDLNVDRGLNIRLSLPLLHFLRMQATKSGQHVLIAGTSEPSMLADAI